MCCLGRFIRETHTGVVPLFAWRLWNLPATLPELELLSPNGAAWVANLAVRHILIRPLGATQVPHQTAGAVRGQGKHVSGELTSLNGATWVPNEAFRAVCDQGAHAVIPSRECSCGVYAVRRRDDLGGEPSPPLVIGMVALWGRVLEYECGYRAERAYPAGLILRPDLDAAKRESLQQCARSYRVPIIGTAKEDRGDALVPALC